MNPLIEGVSGSTVASAITRRALLGLLTAAGSALVGLRYPVLVFRAVSEPARRQTIVSFHMDQPYLDRSGRAMPYHPPPGARSAQAAAHFTEEILRRHSICP
jgi:hypothetical protein